MKKSSFSFIVMLVEIMIFANLSIAAYKLEKADLIHDLQAAGYQILGEDDYFDLPCLKIVLPMNQSIQDVCRRVSYLNGIFFEVREAISVVNGLNYNYPRGNHGWSWETSRENILIPLDTTVQPEIFPEFDRENARYEKFILIDREKQFLGYYESGRLVACFPVSTGKTGKGTPPMEGWIGLRDKNHISSIYDVPMPFSLRLAGPYFIHAGVMPGQPDSAGCIRLFMEHAKWLFERIGADRIRFKVI